MSKSWNRPGTWLVLIAAVFGLLFAFIQVLPFIMKSTATVLHPDPRTAPSATTSEPSQPWATAVDRSRQAMRAGLSERNLPGLSVAVAVDGDIVWAEGFGWADIDKHVQVTPDTRFRIGTASKVLTSAAVGLLMEKHRLSLDERIQTYVPAYPKKEWPVTLRQVMGHVAGIRNDGGDEGPLFSRHCERPADGISAFADRSLQFEPGTDFRYSNYGWILVSAAVEAAANEPFLIFMREQVFKPLQMEDTRTEAATKAATSYFPRFGADPRYGLQLTRDIDLSCYSGSMVFLSTPSDLVRFAIAMNSGKLLRPDTVELLQASQRLTSGKETGYGLGWDLEAVTVAGEQTQVVGHDGEILGGEVMSLMTFPKRGIVVAVMSNMSYADTFSLALKVSDAFASAQAKGAAKN